METVAALCRPLISRPFLVDFQMVSHSLRKILKKKNKLRLRAGVIFRIRLRIETEAIWRFTNALNI